MSPQDWRPITWLLIVFTVAMAIWFVVAFRSTGGLLITDCRDAGEARAVCELEQEARALDPGPVAIMGLWMGGAALLTVAWWATNRDIPHRPIWFVLKTVIGVAVGGVFLAAGIIGYLDDSKESRALAALPAFAAHLSQYTPGTVQPSDAAPYAREGVITVLVPDARGVEGASINGRLYQRLSSLRAGNPGQVRMAALTQCGWDGHHYMGNIGTTATYYECVCRVELVDLTTSPPTAIEVDRQFDSGELPETITADDDDYRWGCPWHDIAAYLSALPRR